MRGSGECLDITPGRHSSGGVSALSPTESYPRPHTRSAAASAAARLWSLMEPFCCPFPSERTPLPPIWVHSECGATVAKVARVSQLTGDPHTRSHDPEDLQGSALRCSKELYYLTLSHLETPGQRKRRGYEEGKCNRCNRMQRPALALLCRLQH